jgi:hypothetical protein
MKIGGISFPQRKKQTDIDRVSILQIVIVVEAVGKLGMDETPLYRLVREPRTV